MKRGRFSCAADVLRDAVRHPYRAPTRIMASSGVAYDFLRWLTGAGLVEIVVLKRRRGRLSITDKGRLFLQYYRALEKLFPSQSRHGAKGD